MEILSASLVANRNRGYHWPVPGINKISQGLHNGDSIDIGAALGTSIVATKTGTISTLQKCPHNTKCSCNGTYGTYIILKHDDNTWSLYAHMKSGSTGSLAVGSRVAQGQKIGEIASSGNSTGNHLLFSLRDARGTGATNYYNIPTANYQNPLDWVGYNDRGAYTISNGDFIHTPWDGRIYRVAGGAPVWVSNWNVLGGPQPYRDISPAEFGALPQYPAPGTFLNSLPAGAVYRVIERGHLYYIPSWSYFGGVQPVMSVDQAGINHNLNCDPRGNVDVIGGGVGNFRIAGWAFDDDTNHSSLWIHVYIGGSAGTGEMIWAGLADGSRSDVNAAYPGLTGNYGFDATIATNRTGDQAVYVYAINAPDTAGNNPLLGSGTVNISPVPIVYVKDVILDKSTLSLKVGETELLTAEVQPANANDKTISWTTENPTVATVNNGLVTAITPGSTTIRAHNAASNIVAECRIDVVSVDTPVSETIQGVRLLQTSITHNALSTSPAIVPVQLVLAQNMMSTLSDSTPASQSIQSVRLTNDPNNYFTATTLDDRRIQLTPTDTLKNISAATSFKTKLELEFTDGGKHTTENELAIHIAKSTPTFKFAAIKLNSFFPGDAETVSVSSGAGQITDIKLAAAPPANADNALVDFDPATRRLTLNAVRPNNKNLRRLAFDITVEGFDVVRNVIANVSVSSTKPTAKLSASTVSMHSTAHLRITSNRPISGIAVYDSKNKVSRENVYTVTTPDSNGNFTLSYKDGQVPRKESLRLRVSFEGAPNPLALPFAVRVPPANPGVKLSRTSVTLSTHANAAGNTAAINLIPNPIDADVGAFAWLYLGSGGAKADNHIEISRIGNSNTVGVTLKPGALPGTYRAELMDGSRRLARLSVKVVATAPKVSFKSKGSLDIIDPESVITLTPKFTNYIYDGRGVRLAEAVNSDFQIVAVDPVRGTLTLQIKDDGRKVARNIKQTVTLEYLDAGGAVVVSAPANITPKQNKPRLSQSTKRIDLQANDRYSEGIIDISVQKPQGAVIDKVEINGTTNAALYEIREVQNGRYALGYKGNNIGNVGRGKNIKLAVYFAGSDTPALISVRVAVNGVVFDRCDVYCAKIMVNPFT